MAYDSGSGISQLAGVLSDRMKAESESPPVLDFAVINDDYSLRTNRFPVDIPKEDYTVCRHLCERELKIKSKDGESLQISGGAHSGHSEGSGSHTHTASLAHEHEYKTRYLKPKDRVLVAWIQNEVCVIDLIVPAKDIQKEGVEL